MVSIIVFGKPRAFESYEYVFDRGNKSVENAHREPILKPKIYDTPILHYYSKEGHAGLELYTRAKGYESERDGIVFGVAIEALSDFRIIDVFAQVLKPFWEDFASALLDDGNRFAEPSIIAQLKSTQWSQSEIDAIQSVLRQHPINCPNKKMLFLEAKEYDDICSVENIIKEYEDVFISGSIDVFTEQINEIVLKEANYQIFQVANGEIVPYVETQTINTTPSISNNGRRRFFPNWGGNITTKGLNELSKGNRDNKSSYSWWSNKKSGSILAGVIGIAAAIILVIKLKTPDNVDINRGNQTAVVSSGEESIKVEDEGVEEKVAVTLKAYRAPIMNSFNLKPHIQPKNSLVIPSDLEFVVSNPELVNIDKSDYSLKVIKRPSVNTTIKVHVKLKSREVGSQTYTIAKNESVAPEKTISSSSVIPPYKGRQRTVQQYLTDLRRALDNMQIAPDNVISECQRIINSDEFKNNQAAVTLREYAKGKKAEAKSNF